MYSVSYMSVQSRLTHAHLFVELSLAGCGASGEGKGPGGRRRGRREEVVPYTRNVFLTRTCRDRDTPRVVYTLILARAGLT